MCGLAQASLVASVVGGFMQYSAVRAQGKAARAEAQYAAAIRDNQAKIIENNAVRADYLAQDAVARGKEKERQERLRGRLLVGQMRAVLASSGQVVDQGSAGDLVIDQEETNELNALTVRNNAQREAQEFRIRATNFRYDADLTRAGANLTRLSGDNALSSAKTEATGTLIGTATSVATKWYEFDRVGAIG